MAEIAWKWVTGSQCLCKGPCKLHFAYLVPSAASGTITLYDGESASDPVITKVVNAAVTSHPFAPKEPISCFRGLYVEVGADVTGALIEWEVA